MIVVKATKDSEEGKFPRDKEKIFAAMAPYHEELAKAGVLLEASGLQPSSKRWRVKYSGGKRTVTDGPFTEAKELIAGFWLWQVKSMQEAVEWLKRAPFQGGDVEIRPIQETEDFAKELGAPEIAEREARLKEQIAGRSAR